MVRVPSLFVAGEGELWKHKSRNGGVVAPSDNAPISALLEPVGVAACARRACSAA